MWLRHIIISGLVLTALALAGFSFVPARVSDTSVHEPLPVKFWEEKAFYDGLPSVGSIKKEPPFAGGIIPHHLLAGSLIGEFFARLALQNPKTIILIGPNHYEVGNAPVISSQKDWKTVFGIVIPERNILDDLYSENIVSFNDNVMIEEHSTQGMMPYMSYFMPQAKVVPLIISMQTTKREMEKLVNILLPYVRDGAIVIAPVDFSHHLTGEESSRNDVITREIIKSKDIDRLLRLNSEYVDSPASIALLIMLMEKTGHGVFTLDHNINSGELLGDRSLEVTSYITGTFR